MKTKILGVLLIILLLLLAFKVFFPPSHIEKGDTYYAQGKWDEAVREYTLANSNSKPEIDASLVTKLDNAVFKASHTHLAKGRTAFVTGDYNTAIKELEEARSTSLTSDAILNADVADIFSQLAVLKAKWAAAAAAKKNASTPPSNNVNQGGAK